jgi:hypothetical protein
MRRQWPGIVLLLGLVLGLGGCTARDVAPRPPKHPEEITVPPVEEAKFSNPPNYPELSNQNDPTRNRNGGVGAQPNLGAMNPGGMGGMGRGMGGMGSMGGMGGGMGGMGGMGR